jgi:hypothetical protein
MNIIGYDFHTRFQQISMLDSETGEVVKKRLDHESGEAKRFYGAGADARLVVSAISRSGRLFFSSFHPALWSHCGGTGTQKGFHSPLLGGEGGRARRPGEGSFALFILQNS